MSPKILDRLEEDFSMLSQFFLDYEEYFQPADITNVNSAQSTQMPNNNNAGSGLSRFKRLALPLNSRTIVTNGKWEIT